MSLRVIRLTTTSARKPCSEAATDFGGDARAVAAVEFALVATVLLLILLGVCDVVPAWLVSAHLSNSASTAADVTAEFSEMQTSDMVNVYAAAADVMSPFSTTNQSLRITNVFSDGNGNAKVYWSCGNGALPAYAALSEVTTTPTKSPLNWFIWVTNSTSGGYRQNGTNTGYVLAEVSYTYTAPASFVLRNKITMSAVAYYLPRISSYVGFPWDGVSRDDPTVPTAATASSSVQLSNGGICNYAL